MQAQAALSGQLVVARQQHADVCLQLQRDHAALQQAALQEHALQKVMLQCLHTAATPHVHPSGHDMLLLPPCSQLPGCKCWSACICPCRSHVHLLLVSSWLACLQLSSMQQRTANDWHHVSTCCYASTPCNMAFSSFSNLFLSSL